MADKSDFSNVGGLENKGYGNPEVHGPSPPYPGPQSYQGPQSYPAPSGYGAQQPYGQPYAGPAYPATQYGQQQQQQANSNNTVVVTSQPYPTNTVVTTAVSDNMGLAIFACLCCFWPLGLFAIFRANESQNALARGDFQAAAKNGRDARLYSLISIGIGIAVIVTIIIIAVTVPMTQTTYYYST